ncbi:Uncharacterised protein [Vibrio cholerae]|nr:Uncharacterised protein [Vibrio cholerae]
MQLTDSIYHHIHDGGTSADRKAKAQGDFGGLMGN